MLFVFPSLLPRSHRVATKVSRLIKRTGTHRLWEEMEEEVVDRNFNVRTEGRWNWVCLKRWQLQKFTPTLYL